MANIAATVLAALRVEMRTMVREIVAENTRTVTAVTPETTTGGSLTNATGLNYAPVREGFVSQAILKLTARSEDEVVLDVTRNTVTDGIDKNNYVQKMSAGNELVTFLVMKPRSAIVRVVHSIFDYRAPLGVTNDEHDGVIFGMLGYRLRNSFPQIFAFDYDAFGCKKVKLPEPEDVQAHFGAVENRTKLMVPTTTGSSMAIPYLALVPVKWAEYFLAKPSTASEVG